MMLKRFVLFRVLLIAAAVNADSATIESVEVIHDDLTLTAATLAK